MGKGQDTTEVVTKYYRVAFGKASRLVAMKRGTTLNYVFADHLGGTSRVTNDSGSTVVDDIRYHAYGTTRSGGTNLPTDRRFTSQTTCRGEKGG